jgi:hypothetical protein
MNVEEMPNWVPSTVKKLAVWLYGFEGDLVRRLVADPQMKSVWQYLLRRAQPVDSAIADDYSQLLLQLGVSEMSISVQERTCAIFFWLVVMELSVQRTAATEQDIENCVAPGVPRRSNAGWLLAPLAAAAPMSSRKRYQ